MNDLNADLFGEFKLSESSKLTLLESNSFDYSLQLEDQLGVREIGPEFKITSESNKKLVKIIEAIVKDNEPLIRERGEGSFKLLMGTVMKQISILEGSRTTRPKASSFFEPSLFEISFIAFSFIP